jgi:hypothetical protein
VWLLVGGSSAIEVLIRHGSLRGIRGAAAIPFAHLGEAVGRARAFFRRSAPVEGERQPLLI